MKERCECAQQPDQFRARAWAKPKACEKGGRRTKRLLFVLGTSADAGEGRDTVGADEGRRKDTSLVEVRYQLRSSQPGRIAAARGRADEPRPLAQDLTRGKPHRLADRKRAER